MHKFSVHGRRAVELRTGKCGVWLYDICILYKRSTFHSLVLLNPIVSCYFVHAASVHTTLQSFSHIIKYLSVEDTSLRSEVSKLSSHSQFFILVDNFYQHL